MSFFIEDGKKTSLIHFSISNQCFVAKFYLKHIKPNHESKLPASILNFYSLSEFSFIYIFSHCLNESSVGFPPISVYINTPSDKIRGGLRGLFGLFSRYCWEIYLYLFISVHRYRKCKTEHNWFCLRLSAIKIKSTF